MKKNGKNICKELKEVRRRIAEENHIPLEIKECTYEGPCKGTCPRCEAEVRYLENALAGKLRMGKVATVAGLALGLASCGGQVTEGEVICDSFPPQDSTVGTQCMPPDSAQGPETNIKVPDVGEMVVTGVLEDICEMPSLPKDSNTSGVKTEDPDCYEVGGIEDDDALLGVVVEDDPEFPGGMEALYKFLQDNVQYPQLALENGIEGRVYVTFVVEEDGSITNPRLLRDIGGGCGQEAIRVVKMMPKWKPGKQQGKVVRVQFNLPVNFVLPEDRPRLIEGLAPIEDAPQQNESPKAPKAPTPQKKADGVKVIVK
ncbi:MAG: energy transducer TonB [Bacteroidales bacterium]|nr:energy transducer TonB [Bacteroidales bacterium]